jgi:hypothetical protein
VRRPCAYRPPQKRAFYHIYAVFTRDRRPWRQASKAGTIYHRLGFTDIGMWKMMKFERQSGVEEGERKLGVGSLDAGDMTYL